MLKIVEKNLKLTWYMKAPFYLPFFIFWLAVFKLDSNPWLPVADFFMAFLVVGSMSSTWDNLDRENGGDRLYASLPVSRDEIATGNMLSGVLFIILGVIFVFVSDILINLIRSKPLFFDVITIPEIIYLFLIIGIFSIVEAILPVLKEIQVNRKVLFLFYISFAMISAFWLIPLLLTGIWSPGYISSSYTGSKNIFIHLVQVFHILGRMIPALIICIITVAIHFTALKISAKKFQVKDL